MSLFSSHIWIITSEQTKTKSINAQCFGSCKEEGRYPYRPRTHVQGFTLQTVGSAQKKVPVSDAGTSASHDVTQV